MNSNIDRDCESEINMCVLPRCTCDIAAAYLKARVLQLIANQSIAVAKIVHFMAVSRLKGSGEYM
jgi:hypothetical protein